MARAPNHVPFWRFRPTAPILPRLKGWRQAGKLHALQEGFWEEHGLQCGFCTPGFLMASVELLQRNPNPTEQEVRHGLEGNMCRCTGYQNIVKAVLHAARTINGGVAVETPVEQPA